MKKEKNKIHIAMTGGGTGGHVFPIKSLIEYIDQKPEYQSKISHLFWFGSKHSLEENICHGLIQHKQSHHLPLTFVSLLSGKYRRETFLKSRIKNIRDIFLFGVGIVQALFFLILYKIDVIFCKWGYVALPVVIAAWILRKKIIVHESDTHSGLVNRIASKMAQSTFTGFDEVLPHAHTVGQILSDDIICDGSLPEYPETEKIIQSNDLSKTQILVVWWSQWSQRLYQSLLKALETDKTIQSDVYFYVVLWLLNKDLKPYFEKFDNVTVFDFVSQKEMGFLCYHCDIAITRAGTTSLAEQKLYNMKLFMVPIPWTHDQYDNAHRYQKQYQDSMIDQRGEWFLNKLVMEIKKHRNFKKNLIKEDRLSAIHIAKEKIWKAILS